MGSRTCPYRGKTYAKRAPWVRHVEECPPNVCGTERVVRREREALDGQA